MRSNRRKNHLPYNWRVRVAQMLKNQGVELNSTKVRDIAAGKYADEILTKKVLRAVKVLEKQHKRHQKIKQNLKAGIAG